MQLFFFRLLSMFVFFALVDALATWILRSIRMAATLRFDHDWPPFGHRESSWLSSQSSLAFPVLMRAQRRAARPVPRRHSQKSRRGNHEALGPKNPEPNGLLWTLDGLASPSVTRWQWNQCLFLSSLSAFSSIPRFLPSSALILLHYPRKRRSKTRNLKKILARFLHYRHKAQKCR